MRFIGNDFWVSDSEGKLVLCFCYESTNAVRKQMGLGGLRQYFLKYVVFVPPHHQIKSKEKKD